MGESSKIQISYLQLYKALGSFPDGARQDRTGIAIAIEQMEKNRHGVKDIKGCDKLLMSDC